MRWENVKNEKETSLRECRPIPPYINAIDGEENSVEDMVDINHR